MAGKSKTRAFLIVLGLLFLYGGALTGKAALQFDVFLGYDGIVPEASWFPVVCEVKNDGPTFMGTVELEGGVGNQGQLQRIVVELPTGTLKRFVLPVFSTTRNYSSMTNAASCARTSSGCGHGNRPRRIFR
jgi:hypothetical protein